MKGRARIRVREEEVGARTGKEKGEGEKN